MRKDSPYYIPSVRVLNNATLFDGVSEQMMEEILGYFSPLSLPKKNVINPWETKEYIFVIISGRVKVSRINPENGREYIINILSNGDIFDVISLLDSKVHEVLIETIDDVQLLKTPIQNARDWLKSHPEFNKNFLPYLGSRMRLLENSATHLALYDTITRLSKLILHYVDENIDGEKKELPLKLINDLSHETISHMIGSVRKVVNLNMQELKKDSIISSVRGKLSIKNLEKLLEKAKENII